MRAPLLRQLLVCLSLAAGAVALTGLAGCKSSELVETEVPAAGVQLRYVLKPGASFVGTVSRRETISTRGTNLNRSLSFTVDLRVNSVDDQGNALVAATVGNINLSWSVPNMPMSTAEFNERLTSRLQNVTIRFSVEPSGKVFDIPNAPAELSDEEKGVLDSVVEGLTSAFFPVPDRPLKAGESWEDTSSRGRAGKLGKYSEETLRGQLAGMYKHRSEGQTLAAVELERDLRETTTTKDGSSEVRTRSKTNVLFNVDADYLASIDSRMTRVQGPTTTTVNFEADWTRELAGSGGAAGERNVTQVQKIEDPCDDNYVGPEDCADPCSVNYMGDAPCPGDGQTPTAVEGTGDAGDAAGKTTDSTGDRDGAASEGSDDAASDAASPDAASGDSGRP